LNVYVDLLRSSASEYSSSKHEQPNQYDEHKNHHNRDNAHAAAAATFVGHERLPPRFLKRDQTGGLSGGNGVTVNQKEKFSHRFTRMSTD